MNFEMKLKSAYFDKIKSGEKIFEIRLFDEKRKNIKTGDLISFRKDPELEEELLTKVEDLIVFKNFEEMIGKLGSQTIGFENKTHEEIEKVYHSFYSVEDENKYGVLAIKIKVIKNIKLYIPKLKDLWFRQQVMEDDKSMEYNAGYKVNFQGYHYDTGCIDFPESKWNEWITNLKNDPNFFYAYILDKETNKFVGYLNFKKDKNNSASMGIVIKYEFQGNGYMRPALNLLIKKAKQNGVKKLIDSVPSTRKNALKVFFDVGFKKVDSYYTKKFDKEELVYSIELKL